ncbi:MAG: hypothetical protein OEZ13_08695 [Spirochaetia bacterium]|nr:hypothetical protein [Spirochaetia bacterium]
MRIISKYRAIIFLILFSFYSGTLLSETEFDALKSRGMDFFYKKRYHQALEQFEEILETRFDDSGALFYYDETFALILSCELWLTRAKELSSQARYNQALESVIQAEKIYPFHPSINSIKDEINDMTETAKPLAHLAPEEQDIFYNTLHLGYASLEKGNNEEAINLFAKCLSLAPKSPEAIEGYNEAQKRFKEKAQREKLISFFNKAAVFESQKKYPMAVSVYEEILRISPGNSEAHEKKQRLEEMMRGQRDLAQKIQLAKEFLDSGNKHLTEKRFNEAIEQYELGLSTLPDFTNWDNLIAKVQKYKKSYEEKKFEEHIREINKSFEKGLFYYATEKYKKAISSFENVINISENYVQMSETKNQAKDYLRKAQENLQQREEEAVSAESPYYKLVQSLNALGFRQYEKKDYKSAKKYFSSILELFPKNKEAGLYYIICSIKIEPETKENVISELIEQIDASLKTSPSEARRLIDIALQIDKNHPKIKPYIEKKPKKQIIAVKSTVPKETINKWYQEALSLSQTNPKKALEISRKIIKEDPLNTKARNLLTRLEARVSPGTSKAVKKIDARAQKAYTQGIMFYNSGKINDAINSFKIAVKISPDFTKAQNALAKCEAYQK